MEIVALMVCTSKFVRMKDHLSFGREFVIFSISDRVVVDHVVKL